MKKIVSLLLAVIFMITFISGCKGGDKQEESGVENNAGNISLGICVYDYADEFSMRLRESVETYAEKSGCKYDVSDGGNEQSTQNSQISSYILSGVNALCVNLVDRYSGVNVADDARAAGIPVIFLSRRPVDEAIALYDRSYYVGISEEEAGTLLGELMAECWNTKRDTVDKNGDGIFQCAVFTCSSDSSDMKTRIDAAIKAMEMAGVSVQKVNEDDAAITKDKAREKLNAWYSDGGGEIEGVISAKDEVALGAIEALTAKGFFSGDNYMPVVSVGGIPAAVQAIAEGVLYGTVSLNPDEQSKIAVQMTLDIANGKLGETVNGYTITDRNILIPCEKINSTNYMDHI